MANEKDEKRSIEDLTAKLISVTEASQISGLSPAWVRRLLQNGEVEGTKVGRNWLTTEKAIRDYLEKDRRPGPKKE